MSPRRRTDALANVFFKAVPIPIEKASRVLLVVVAAPAFGARRFGTYQFATTVAALVTTSAELGLGTWITRALVRDGNRTRALIAAGLRVRLGMILPCALVLAVVAGLEGPGEGRRTILLLGGAAMAGAFVDHLGATLRGLEDFRREALVNVGRAVITSAAGLLGLHLTRSLPGFATGLLAGAVASAALGQWVVRMRTSERVVGPGRESAAIPFADLAPLWLASLLSTLYFRCDIVFLRLFVGAAELGDYSAAYRVFEALMLVPSTIVAVAFPRLARREPTGPARVELPLTALLGGLGLLAAAAAYFASDHLVALVFGGDFARAAVILRALAFSVPVLFVNFALTVCLFARGDERRYLAIVALALVFNVGLNLVAIPRWGGLGAAAATFVSEVVLAFGCLFSLTARGTPNAGRARSA